MKLLQPGKTIGTNSKINILSTTCKTLPLETIDLGLTVRKQNIHEAKPDSIKILNTANSNRIAIENKKKWSFSNTSKIAALNLELMKFEKHSVKKTQAG